MNIKLARFNRRNAEYVDLIKHWWFVRKNMALPVETMSDYGFMAIQDDRPVCAIFLFMPVGCDMCLIGWPIANVASSLDERRECLRLLVASCEETAKEIGYKVIMSYASTGAMKERMNEFGYMIGDTNCDNYIKVLR